ncbi:MAG TPA: copper resistance protein CopC [Candidatus Limnocylindria bacterium]|nr:copper resistance protein CopC [Candidatus Limnocylindria bacterium]
MVTAGPAAAHADLVSSTPAANASLLATPPAVSMTFTEAIDPATASVLLLDDRQRAVVGLGTPAVDQSGLSVTVTVPMLDPGVYTVSYRVTSAVDGHVSTGIWAFLVDPTGSQPPPAVPAQSSSPSSDLPTVLARWVALAAGLVLVGMPLFWLVSARPALAASAGGDGWRRAAPWGAIALAGAVAFGALAIYLTLAARPFVEAGAHPGHGGGGFPLDFAAPFGATPFAAAMRVAEIGAAAGFFLATARAFVLDDARRRDAGGVPDREVRMLVLMVASGAISLAGSSLAGHAAARGGLLFAAIDWAHLLAVGAWVGTLPGLLLLARRTQRGTGPGVLAAALGRHSRLALAAAPIVAMTGIANSPLVVGGSRDLVGSDYGNALLAKVVLFSIAVAIGSANFFLIRGRAHRRTLPLVAVELAIAALAVLAASTLVTSQPAASRVSGPTPSAIGALHLYGELETTTVHAAVILPSPGDQSYQVSVSDTATGQGRTDVQKVILVFGAPSDSGLPDQRVDLAPGVEPWLWGTSGAYTPLLGDWTLEVIVRRVGLRDETLSFELPVSEPLPPSAGPPPDTGFGVPAAMALLWLALPPGPLGWGVPLFLLAAAATALALERSPRGRIGGAVTGLRLALVVLAVLTGVGAGSRAAVEAANAPPPAAAATQNPVAPSPESVERGRDIYLANCAACHGLNGTGDGPTAARMLPGPGDLASGVPRLSDGGLAYLIASGTVATRMPAFSSTLSEADRWDLVNYLRATWPDPEHP